MAVPALLLGRLVARPLADEALVDSLRGARADEGVPEAMEPRHHRRRSAVDRTGVVVGRLVRGQREDPRALSLPNAFQAARVRLRPILAVGVPGRAHLLRTARVANVLRRLTEEPDRPPLDDALRRLDALIADHAFFETLAMQCAHIDPARGVVTLANAGFPDPVRYCPGSTHATASPSTTTSSAPGPASPTRPFFERRRAEFVPGDVLLMMTDGLIEDGHDEFYGERLPRLIRPHAARPARALGEAILDDWRARPRSEDIDDEATVLVAMLREPSHALRGPR